MANAFDIAAAQLGLNETDKVAALNDYLTTGGANLDPATTAWCAAFVNASLSQAGVSGTGSNMARSFLDWGVGVEDPQRGDIAVFSRGDPKGPFGHVGFFDGYNEDGTIRVLGGNQGDAVSIANYSPDQLLGFRRADGAPLEAGMAAPPPQPPQDERPNALPGKKEEENALRFADTSLDPRDFMSKRNALAFVPIAYQPTNRLGSL